MKRKKISEAPVKAPDKQKGRQITVQVVENYLVLDIWQNGVCRVRHAMHTDTGEYETCHTDTGCWTRENLNSAAGYKSCYYGDDIDEEVYTITQKDKGIIKTHTENTWSSGNIYKRIADKEREYNYENHKKQEYSKQARLNALMEPCRTPGIAVKEWIVKTAVAGQHYMFWEKGKEIYHCTACRGSFPAAGFKRKNKEQTDCPLCGHPVTVIKRRDRIAVETALTVIHDLDEKRGVERHFQAEIQWTPENGRTVILDETIRVMLLRKAKHSFKIYYDNWGAWSERNRTNKSWKTGYLYPDRDGIRAGLAGTAYEVWSDVFPQLAEAGIVADYNRMLVESNKQFAGITEYLFKGRFFRLLKETSEDISFYLGYMGPLRTGRKTIEEIMNLEDRQKINRLRQENGGTNMLQWLQWSEQTEEKISTECLNWMETEAIDPDYYEKRAGKYLTPEQLMHYITRQQTESYKGKKVKEVLGQYEDYLSMAESLGKHMDDEMVYRPRELKRRHDEAVEECNIRREELQRQRDAEAAKEQAEAMRRKYPGYEDILAEVKEKYEYADGTYLIRVPQDFAEITAEGMALHHCVANTERYFDRIVSRETYICFLRQQSSPDTPFYTIEVEPGGTIRQHRGAYDEEPGIEEIKPFLREWQRTIRKRMSRKDHEYAKASAVLREKNIEELKAKNNTRVLDGLMEDLMEVI